MATHHFPQSLSRLGLDADPTCPDHVMEILRLLIILPPWIVHHIHGFKYRAVTNSDVFFSEAMRL